MPPETPPKIIETLGVHPGDRVTLWGGNPRLDDVAAQAKTISYELLTRIGPRVQRVIER